MWAFSDWDVNSISFQYEIYSVLAETTAAGGKVKDKLEP